MSKHGFLFPLRLEQSKYFPVQQLKTGFIAFSRDFRGTYLLPGPLKVKRKQDVQLKFAV